MAPSHPTQSLSYAARADLPGTSSLAAFLYRLMDAKKTNLAVSADVTTSAELLALAEQVGDSICVFKTHVDIVCDFNADTAKKLREIAMKKGFVVFEDRKLGDIGSTVQKQYAAGTFAIATWAELVNAHIFPGPPIISALAAAEKTAAIDYDVVAEPDRHPIFRQLGAPSGHGLLLLAQMSSAGCLMTTEYTAECVNQARLNPGFVVGFIAQQSLNTAPSDNFLTLAPGIKLVPAGGDAGDGLGQQYSDPRTMVAEKGIDIAIVGRGILAAANRSEAAETYRQAAWGAYLERVA